MNRIASEPFDDARNWWRTSIIDIAPNSIRVRGYPIEDLIGSVSFPQMIWLMTRGEIPTADESQLLEAALVASVDHGPQAPSIAIARMAMTCGVELNNAMGSAVNVLGEVHGGAGQQAMELYAEILQDVEGGAELEAAVGAILSEHIAERKIIPGFGHRFHKTDPRAVRIAKLLEVHRNGGTVSGRFLDIAHCIEGWLAQTKGRPIPMNIDGITAVVFSELGFAAPLGRGLFILSRAVGVLAHAFEEGSQGGRIKGPMPVSVPYTYDGPPARRYDGGGDNV